MLAEGWGVCRQTSDRWRGSRPVDRAKTRFRRARHVKPPASRSDLARNLFGGKRVPGRADTVPDHGREALRSVEIGMERARTPTLVGRLTGNSLGRLEFLCMMRATFRHEAGMSFREALTFDDVLLQPAESAVLPRMLTTDAPDPIDRIGRTAYVFGDGYCHGKRPRDRNGASRWYWCHPQKSRY